MNHSAVWCSDLAEEVCVASDCFVESAVLSPALISDRCYWASMVCCCLRCWIFLQNWPVRGSGSSFLAHLSGSDSFCNGIINRVISFCFPLAARAKTCHFKRRPCVCVPFRQSCINFVGAPAQQGRERDVKDWDLPFQRTEHSPCVWSWLVEPHWLFLQRISQAYLPLSHPALYLIHWHLQSPCRCTLLLMLGCDLNTSPEFNTHFLLKCVGGLQVTWSQQSLFKMARCKPVEKMTVLSKYCF